MIGIISCARPVAAQSFDETFGTVIGMEETEQLELLVMLNGRDTGVICTFTLVKATGALSASRADLADAGIEVPASMGRQIRLSELTTPVYDAARQTIEIDVPTAMLVPRVLLAHPPQEAPVAGSGWGMVLNYQLAAGLGDDIAAEGMRVGSLYAGLELRAYSPIGVLSVTGAASRPDADADADADAGVAWTRHDTRFVHVARSRMLMLTLGDFVSAGPSWSSALRMAGVQVRRDFSLDPSFLTDPQLSYSGVAVLPSALDVFVNNVKAWSGKVDAGPFVLGDLPMVTPQGEAVFVLRDASGREYVNRVPFFSTRNLLRKGVADYALQIGFPREDYGRTNLDYGSERIGSASLRYGISDWMTVGGHVAAASDLLLVGAGVDMAVFDRAELGLSVAQSQTDLSGGQLVAVALRTRVAGVDIRATERRRLGGFLDLGSYLSERQGGTDDPTGYRAADLERALSLSVPLGSGTGFASLSLVQTKRQAGEAVVLSASYARSIGSDGGSVRINTFLDLSDRSNSGLTVGLSFPFGADRRVDIQTGLTPRGLENQANLSRHAGQEVGDLGYRLAVYDRQSARSASFGVTHQGRYARSELTLRNQNSAVSAKGTATGSVVLGGGGVFAARRIADGLAIVDVGVPGIPVSLNNRPVAVTGRNGKALVGDLRSYQVNRLSIDPLTLPPTAWVNATAMDVVPMRQSGVSLSFGGGTDMSALVVLRDAAGAFLPVGTSVSLRGGDSVPVGYDGEVWIEGLKPRNDLTATTASGACHARFAYAPDPDGEQVVIDPVLCE
ncbi:hypothetical protein HYN69_12360 [Gemmobacter aquarius]|uniref:PapC-like C-terminal domain-containing protein n=1 Tax=Paragemmobacter aquarius TaxID=2169400 RepID=A0A2S0UN21_9RHOB|nr:fimbria/pilus outer membrane usher protein [Gemmobacter aquarius]AWB49190.1 hypothetical protein HYN69_12360 [Gemmobacter aquarius]